MKQDIICKLKKSGLWDPVYIYILAAAAITFMDIAFLSYMQTLYELFLVIPCILALGVLQGRGIDAKSRKIFLLPLVMLGWYTLVQVDHDVESARVYNAGLFFCVYLFAFPLATILRDGDQKKALKIFAGAYLAAAAVLAMLGLMLTFDCLPGFLRVSIRWDGTRLWAFWHANILAGFFMIGIIFCVTFLCQVKSLWIKAGLLLLTGMMIIAMALTHCRTVTLVTGGFLGATLFFWMIKHGKKWFMPGVLAAAVLAAAFFTGENRIYKMNSDAIVEKYIQQQAEMAASETDSAAEEKPEKAKKADKAKKEPGNTQGTLAEDMGSLNGRTVIWRAAMKALRDNPRILLLGVENPGPYVSAKARTFIFTHLHNAWIECLVGMGVVGFLTALAFTLITGWNCLIILLKHHQNIWKRNVALLCLCLMGISMLEPYLFYTDPFYTTMNFVFFLCAGYLVCWQEDDNRRILAVIRSRLSFGKK